MNLKIIGISVFLAGVLLIGYSGFTYSTENSTANLTKLGLSVGHSDFVAEWRKLNRRSEQRKENGIYVALAGGVLLIIGGGLFASSKPE